MLYKFRRERLLSDFPIYIGGLSSKMTDIYDRRAQMTRRQLPRVQLMRDVAPFILNDETVRDAPLRAQLRAEIEAQFAAFEATGLALDHVNAHKHFHLHPTIAGLLGPQEKEDFAQALAAALAEARRGPTRTNVR